jgi:hypothetical protein
MQMIMFVLNNPNQLDAVLDAWREVGVNGVTIAETTGLHRRRARLVGARYTFGWPQALGSYEEGHYTLFAVVPDLQNVQRCLDAVEKVIGNLDEPHTGIFASWELSRVKGVPDRLLRHEDDL